MRVYGIKNAQVSLEFEAMEVVDHLPSTAQQGAVLFLRGQGICVYSDGGWDLMPLNPLFREQKPADQAD